MKTLLVALFASSLLGCGAGPYGHARTYSPTSAEERALIGAEDFDPVMARRQPEAWARKRVGLFAIVLGRKDGPDGALELEVSLRTLEARNLCEDASEDSCRTTVSDHEFDRLRVRLAGVSGPDRAGPTSIGPGSLLRVVGTVPQGTEVVVVSSFYRHWPRGYYVTTAASNILRR